MGGFQRGEIAQVPGRELTPRESRRRPARSFNEEGSPPDEAIASRLPVNHLDLLEGQAVEEEAVLPGLVGAAHRGVVGADGDRDPAV